jgi:hypothetical protein
MINVNARYVPAEKIEMTEIAGHIETPEQRSVKHDKGINKKAGRVYQGKTEDLAAPDTFYLFIDMY